MTRIRRDWGRLERRWGPFPHRNHDFYVSLVRPRSNREKPLWEFWLAERTETPRKCTCIFGYANDFDTAHRMATSCSRRWKADRFLARLHYDGRRVLLQGRPRHA